MRTALMLLAPFAVPIAYWLGNRFDRWLNDRRISRRAEQLKRERDPG